MTNKQLIDNYLKTNKITRHVQSMTNAAEPYSGKLSATGPDRQYTTNAYTGEQERIFTRSNDSVSSVDETTRNYGE